MRRFHSATSWCSWFGESIGRSSEGSGGGTPLGGFLCKKYAKSRASTATTTARASGLPASGWPDGRRFEAGDGAAGAGAGHGLDKPASSTAGLAETAVTIRKTLHRQAI
jgi:hypothetical protein